VLISYTELQALRQTVAIVSDPRSVAGIPQAEADVLARDTTGADELREVMLARRPATA